MSKECETFLGCVHRRALLRSSLVKAEKREDSVKVFKRRTRAKSPSFALVWAENGEALVACVSGRTGSELAVRLGLVRQGNVERLAEQAIGIAIIHLAL